MCRLSVNAQFHGDKDRQVKRRGRKGHSSCTSGRDGGVNFTVRSSVIDALIDRSIHPSIERPARCAAALFPGSGLITVKFGFVWILIFLWYISRLCTSRASSGGGEKRGGRNSKVHMDGLANGMVSVSEFELTRDSFMRLQQFRRTNHKLTIHAHSRGMGL